MAKLEVHQFPCLSDNYGYLIHDSENNLTATIDAPEVAPINKALSESVFQGSVRNSEAWESMKEILFAFSKKDPARFDKTKPGVVRQAYELLNQVIAIRSLTATSKSGNNTPEKVLAYLKEHFDPILLSPEKSFGNKFLNLLQVTPEQGTERARVVGGTDLQTGEKLPDSSRMQFKTGPLNTRALYSVIDARTGVHLRDLGEAGLAGARLEVP